MNTRTLSETYRPLRTLGTLRYSIGNNFLCVLGGGVFSLRLTGYMVTR